jgi:hypothetical protein
MVGVPARISSADTTAVTQHLAATMASTVGYSSGPHKSGRIKIAPAVPLALSVAT